LSKFIPALQSEQATTDIALVMAETGKTAITGKGFFDYPNK
jgi:hypothetical protein